MVGVSNPPVNWSQAVSSLTDYKSSTFAKQLSEWLEMKDAFNEVDHAAAAAAHCLLPGRQPSVQCAGGHPMHILYAAAFQRLCATNKALPIAQMFPKAEHTLAVVGCQYDICMLLLLL